MYLPMTTRHTVSGMARNSPTVPHSHVQNAAATSSAIGETPVRLPIEPRLQHHVADQLEDDEQARHQRRLRPVSNTAKDSATGSAAATQIRCTE